MAGLIFLKLGGSLITDKDQAHTPRPDVLARLAAEIAASQREDPSLHLVLGHGSGSFGHVPGRKYGTRHGVRSPEQWRGFAEVWQEAAQLNRLVMEALRAAGVAALAFPPSAGALAQAGRVHTWDLSPLRAALSAGLLPVVFGDVAFDTVQGGTILSTEDLFDYLATGLHPQRVLLAGREPGVWADFPACTRLVTEITADSLASILPGLAGSASTDVTGGMASKVSQALDLTRAQPGLEVRIFSGSEPGAVRRALAGEPVGTRIVSS